MKSAKPAKRNQPKKQKKQPKNVPRNQQLANIPRQPRQPQIRLTQCAVDYWHTLANPTEDAMGCVPANISTMSFKQRCFARGTGQTGTTGEGFIVADPYNASMNNVDCVAATNATYNGTVINYVAGQVDLAFSNSNYTQIQIGGTSPKAQVRVVGAMLSLKFTGTRLNAGGTVFAIHDRNHDILTNRGIVQLGADLATRVFQFDERTTYIYYSPAQDDDLDFVAVAGDSFNGASATSDRYYMGAYIQSAALKQPFYWEFWVVSEFQGRDVRGQTPNHTDPNAIAAAASVMGSSFPTQKGPKQFEKSLFSKATEYLTQGVTTVTEGVNFARNLGNAYTNLSNLSVSIKPSPDMLALS